MEYIKKLRNLPVLFVEATEEDIEYLSLKEHGEEEEMGTALLAEREEEEGEGGGEKTCKAKVQEKREAKRERKMRETTARSSEKQGLVPGMLWTPSRGPIFRPTSISEHGNIINRANDIR